MFWLRNKKKYFWYALLTKGLDPTPDPSPIDHPWDIVGRRVYDRIPSKLPHFPNWNTSWLNKGNAFHKRRVGLVVQPHASFKPAQKPHRIECIHKGGVHTKHDLQYIHL